MIFNRYTGYGSWDDSMASVIALIPKKPKKDLAKLFFNEGKTLRFSAKFSGDVFWISYRLYLPDVLFVLHLYFFEIELEQEVLGQFFEDLRKAMKTSTEYFYFYINL